MPKSKKRTQQRIQLSARAVGPWMGFMRLIRPTKLQMQSSPSESRSPKGAYHLEPEKDPLFLLASQVVQGPFWQK